MQVKKRVLGMVGTNVYLIVHTDTKEAILIDPADAADRIKADIEALGVRLAGILLTHGHFDHIWGLAELRERSGAKVYAYAGEKALCGDARLNVSAGAGRACTADVDVYGNDGDEITIAGITCRLIATPGHTEGSCCYYFPDGGFLISGDTLFAESVGRTDLPTGEMGALVRSVKEKLFVLPDETRVYPGHGEATEIGYEKKYNPFCG